MEWDWLDGVTYWNFVGERSRGHYWREDFFCNSRIFPTNYFLMIFFLSIRFCILSLLVSHLFVLVVQYKFLPASQTVEHSNRKEHNRIQCWHSLMMRHKSMSAEWFKCSGKYDFNKISIDQIEKNCNINIVIRVKLFALPIGISVRAFLARRIVTVCCR